MLFSLPNFVHYFNLIVGLGAIGLLIVVVLLSIFAKPLLDAAMAVVLPILQVIGEGLGKLIGAVGSFLWNVFAVALPDFFKGPWQDRVALAIILAITYSTGWWMNTTHNCPAVRADIRAEYKLIPRTAKERAVWKLHHPGQWF